MPVEKIKKATSYLNDWKHKSPSWKFCKTMQTYLMKEMWNYNVVDKKTFKILVEYLKDIKGAARDRLIKSANEIIEISNNPSTPSTSDKQQDPQEDSTEKKNDVVENSINNTEKMKARRLKRARKIVKILQSH